MLDTVARSRRLGTPSTYFLFLMLRFLSIASLASVFAFSPVHARTCGTASFYGLGDGFAWQTMANGQPMNPAAMITAHPSLPLGSKISVRNPANGKSVKVTVTDRGPFYGNRILDLSAGAFSRIASTGQGLARVCYRLV
ncbi:MAG: septal ring lytic transglycosylase RlpA family protein [Burkholderiaceae bacterium]